jgi:hypothetical protein
MSTIRSGSVTDPKEIAKLRSQANDILTLPQRVGNMIESFSAVNTDIEEAKSRAGKMGGLDLSTKSEMIEHMAVLMNEKPGKRETRIDYKDGKYSAVFVITPEGGKPQEYTEEQLRKYLSGEQQGAQIIPDETENMSNLAKSYLTVKDAATDKRVKSKSIYGNPTTRTIKANGQTIVETYRPLNRNGLIKGAMGVIKANISAMSINQKVSFMNNIVSPDKKGYDSTNINSKESVEALEKGYGEYWLNKFTDGDQVLSTRVVKPEEGNLSAADKKTAQMKKDLNNDLSTLQNTSLINIDRESLTNLAQKIGVAVSQDDVSTANGEVYYNIPIRGSKGFLKVTKNDSTEDVIKVLLKAKGYKSSEVDRIVKGSREGKGPLSNDFLNPSYFEGGSNNSAARFN